MKRKKDEICIRTLIPCLLPMIIFIFVVSHQPLCVHAVISCCYGWVVGVSSETLWHIRMSTHAEFRQSWLNCHFHRMFCFLARSRSDSPLVVRISRRCDDRSRQRHQQILSACRIRSCVHLAEVNLLYNRILDRLPVLIFWAFCVWWHRYTPCVTHLDGLFILQLKSGFWLSLAKAQGNTEQPRNYLRKLPGGRTRQRESEPL